MNFLFRYSPSIRADIGKYACQHGITAAAIYFSKKLENEVCTSTVQSIKKAYLEGVREKRLALDEGDVTSLPSKKRGRPIMLGKELDQKVQMYLHKVREGGGVVTARIAIAAARGIILAADRSMLAEFGGHINLTTQWAYSLLGRMHFVQRKSTTAKSRNTPENFTLLKKDFLDQVVATVVMEEIPPELILNWDQTGIKIVPSSTWTMNRRGARRVEVVGVNDKRLITAVFCGSLTGDFLPVQVIYKGKTARCHPRYQFPDNWHVTHSHSHWSTEVTMLDYVKEIIIPYVASQRDMLNKDCPALVIVDNFKEQVTSSILDLLEQNEIHVCLLPPNTTDRLQPMDISVNKPAKEFLRKKF